MVAKATRPVVAKSLVERRSCQGISTPSAPSDAGSAGGGASGGASGSAAASEAVAKARPLAHPATAGDLGRFRHVRTSATTAETQQFLVRPRGPDYIDPNQATLRSSAMRTLGLRLDDPPLLAHRTFLAPRPGPMRAGNGCFAALLRGGGLLRCAAHDRAPSHPPRPVPDRPGLVAAISSFLFRHGANILDFDQHTIEPRGPDEAASTSPGWSSRPTGSTCPSRTSRRPSSSTWPGPARWRWRLTRSDRKKRVAVLVSKHDHALLELLWAWRRGDLRAEVPLVVSNHPDLGESMAAFGVPFVHVPNSPRSGPTAEARMARGSTARSTWSCSPATCRCSLPPSSARCAGAAHQHPPLLPSRLRRRRPLPPGLRSRRQDRGGHRPLRHRRARRRPDHRAGRGPGLATATRSRTWSSSAATSSAGCWSGRSAGTARTGCIVHGNKTMVFS